MRKVDERPELEFVLVDGGSDDGADVELNGRGPRRRWLGGLAVTALAGVVIAALTVGGAPKPKQAAEPIAPSPTVADEPAPVTGRADDQRYGGDPINVVPTSDGQGVWVSTARWSGVARLLPELGQVTGAVGRRSHVVVVLSTGQARALSRSIPQGVPLGGAVAAYPGPIDDSTWLVGLAEGRQGVHLIEVDGASGFVVDDGKVIAVPDGWRLRGGTSGVLVLERVGGRPGLALWDPKDVAGPLPVARSGAFVAAGEGWLAWRRGDRLVAELASGQFHWEDPAVLAGLTDVVAAAFAPGGLRLAVMGTAPESTFVRVAGDPGTSMPNPPLHLNGAQRPAMAWGVDGMLVVDPEAFAEYVLGPGEQQWSTRYRFIDRTVAGSSPTTVAGPG